MSRIVRPAPFETLAPPDPNDRPPPMVRIGMIAGRRRKRGRSASRMQILIRERVLDLLGPNLPHSYVVELGRDHAVRHEIHIRRAKGGPFNASRQPAPGKRSDVLRILLDRHARFPPYRVDPQEVDFRHDEAANRLIVTLPSWAFDATERERLDHQAAVLAARTGEPRVFKAMAG